MKREYLYVKIKYLIFEANFSLEINFNLI